MGNCYQFNTQTSLSWKEAYVSCQNQGADLLSIKNTAELIYLKGRFHSPLGEQITEILKMFCVYLFLTILRFCLQR